MAVNGVNNTLIGILLDDRQAKQNAALLIYNIFVTSIVKSKLNSGYVSNCHLLNVGSISYHYNFFHVPYFKELEKLETYTNEFGFRPLWETYWMTRFHRRVPKMASQINEWANATSPRGEAVLKSIFVNFLHLERLFVFCAILGMVCIGIFIFETISQPKKWREVYWWFNVVSTFLCLQCFKVCLIINRLRYVNQR